MQVDADLSIPPVRSRSTSPVRELLNVDLSIPPVRSRSISPVHELLNATYVIRDSADSSMPEMDLQSSFIEDRSFDDGRSFSQPAPQLDESLRDRSLDDSIPDDAPVTFNVVEGGTKRGGQKLVSSDGYTYTRRNVKEGRVYWTCSIRNRNFKCMASVKQYGDLFTPSLNGHQHPAVPGALKKVTIAAKVKQVARENVFRPAGEIVETVMKDLISAEEFALPKPDLLIRAANLHRQNLRPTDPTTVDFEINPTFIGPDFVADDIRVDDQRHIFLATTPQLQQLKQARRWFLDGTFKLVKRPFYQLMSVHAFVRKGEDAKQVPLAYVLMSRRTKQDYIAVLTSLRSKLERPQVEWFMLDFEAAAWQALREVFPGCVLKGCVFHWSQRVYRKIQSEVLATAYLKKEDKYRYLRKLLSLPYLPSEQIPSAFHQLKQQALEVGGPILHVTQYVQGTWIEGSMWQPNHWSVFRETVRTNNDVEGWHRRINTRAGRADLEFYLLVPLLRREAKTVDLQIRLVSALLLTRLHRARYARLHGALFDAWDKYEDGELTTTQLLRRCSNIAGLGPSTGSTNSAVQEDV
ncbi:uncharacterized protein LOC123549348 [Mercenaria mercenaria]|uniref:uncharacterized protein LOC123549348 n=1 Tax=Mercenaria mercenaria TaxID=6596 RepID=UPI00234F1A3F|nr:uncharacterized protein LOC123549348 [Mercenaria mercenaria]